MPSAYRVKKNPEPELGIVPLIAAAAAPAVGGIVKGIGGLFKKKHKGGGPAPAAASEHHDSGATEHHEAAGLVGVPTDVKQDALAALKSYQKENHANAAKQAALVKKLAKVVKPQVDAMKAQVAKQALKQQVTSEHNKLVKEDERWAANDAAHKAILSKFDELESALLGSNKNTQRVFKIYGINV